MSRLNNELKIYVEHLYDEGRRTHSDLRDAELERITGLIMQQRTISEQWEFIIESPMADDFLKPFTNWLKDGDADNQAQVLMQLKQGAKLFAHNQIDELLEARAEQDYEHGISDNDMMLSAYHRDLAQHLNSLNHASY